MKNRHGRIKKLKKEIETWKFEGLIIDRSKSQQAIDNQIDQLAEESQKAEFHGGISELAREGGQYSEGLGGMMPGSGNLDRPHSRMMERDGVEKEGRPKRKRRERAKPLEVELDLVGGFPRNICRDQV